MASGSSQASRGIPRKARNAARKARHNRYWDKATCFQCRVTFRSPKKKLAHIASSHTFMPAIRAAHMGSVETRLAEIKAGMGKRTS